MKRIVIGILIGWAVMGTALKARSWWRNRPTPPAPRGTIRDTLNVAPNLYVVRGGGGNSAVFVTANGVVLVDTKYPENWPGLLEQIKKVTDKPITHVINTHSHLDHAGSDRFIGPEVEIIAQENTARNIVEGTHLKHPIKAFKDKLTLFDGADAVDIYYFGPGHTDGDVFVVFRAARVMHAGDLFPGKVPPIVNIPWGGNGREFADTLTKAAAAIPGVDTVISGHDKVFTWADFVKYGDFNRTLLEQVRAGVRAGKDRNQISASLKFPDEYSDYNLGRLDKTVAEICVLFGK